MATLMSELQISKRRRVREKLLCSCTRPRVSERKNERADSRIARVQTRTRERSAWLSPSQCIRFSDAVACIPATSLMYVCVCVCIYGSGFPAVRRDGFSLFTHYYTRIQVHLHPDRLPFIFFRYNSIT